MALQFALLVTIPSGGFIHLGLAFHGVLMEETPRNENIPLTHLF